MIVSAANAPYTIDMISRNFIHPFDAYIGWMIRCAGWVATCRWYMVPPRHYSKVLMYALLRSKAPKL